MGDDKWELLVVPHFREVVAKLQPSLLLDDLRESRLVTKQEYRELWELPTDLERARRLVNDLLPLKGDDSLDKFCNILLKTQGQEHIVRDIIMYSPAREASKQSNPSRSKELKFAVFIFKEEHRESINDEIQGVIRDMCRRFFKIDKTSVKFEFKDNICEKGYVCCYCDLKGKLVVLKLYGVAPKRMKSYRRKLVGCIVTFLDQYKVKRRDVLLRETLPGCSFIILDVDFDSFIDLLCLLGQEEQNGAKQLGVAVQKAIPNLQKGLLILGGLPAIELFNEVQSTHLLLSPKRTLAICTTLRRKLLGFRIKERMFPEVDRIDDVLNRIKEEVTVLKDKRLPLCQSLEFKTAEALTVLTTKAEKLQSEESKVCISTVKTLPEIKKKYEIFRKKVDGDFQTVLTPKTVPE
jgi:hypothetical protein